MDYINKEKIDLFNIDISYIINSYLRLKKDIILLTDVDKNKYLFDEYKEKVAATQTDKNGKIVYLYTYNVNSQYTYIETLKSLLRKEGFSFNKEDLIKKGHIFTTSSQDFTSISGLSFNINNFFIL